MSTPSDKRIALITGANKGLGFETARQLGRDHGMTVLLGARDRERGRDATARLSAEGIDARSVVLDITDPASVKSAAQGLEREFGRLDVLVNNAGTIVQGDGAAGTVPVDAVRDTFETNFLGALNVTQAMLPLLRKSTAALIVNVSSGLGSITNNNDPAWEYAAVKPLGYNASKAALNMLTVHLASELRAAGIKVNSADPGYTATDLNHHNGPKTLEQGVRSIVYLATLPATGPTGGFFDDQGPLPW